MTLSEALDVTLQYEKMFLMKRYDGCRLETSIAVYNGNNYWTITIDIVGIMPDGESEVLRQLEYYKEDHPLDRDRHVFTYQIPWQEKTNKTKGVK